MAETTNRRSRVHNLIKAIAIGRACRNDMAEQDWEQALKRVSGDLETFGQMIGIHARFCQLLEPGKPLGVILDLLDNEDWIAYPLPETSVLNKENDEDGWDTYLLMELLRLNDNQGN